jgi:hypothetical protein
MRNREITLCLAFGHSSWSCERKELVQLSSISDIAAWESRDVSYQDPRGRESRSACWIGEWSPPVVA